MTTITSEESKTSFGEKTLLPKGVYRFVITRVTEPMPSSFKKKDGRDGDPFVFVDFTVTAGKFRNAEFSCAYPWAMWQRHNKDGVRIAVSALQEMAEGFYGREIPPRETVDFDALIDGAREATGAVVQQVSKDGKKTFNRIETFLDMDDRPPCPVPDPVLQAAAALGYQTTDDEPF